MRQSSESSESSLFSPNAYLWAFIPAVVFLSAIVFVICFVVLLLGRAKAAIA
jgi:hypothetical protein